MRRFLWGLGILLNATFCGLSISRGDAADSALSAFATALALERFVDANK